MFYLLYKKLVIKFKWSVNFWIKLYSYIDWNSSKMRIGNEFFIANAPIRWILVDK